MCSIENLFIQHAVPLPLFFISVENLEIMQRANGWSSLLVLSCQPRVTVTHVLFTMLTVT